MKVDELTNYLKEGGLERKITDQSYWEEIWDMYVHEASSTYKTLSTKEAITRLISETNFKNRSCATNCEELGVWIRVGDICYIDFGINYINEAGFQHFGLIISIDNNKVLVIPMTSNEKTYKEAILKKGKSHLLAIGKIEGMYRESTLFMNDAKYINSARIIDVKAHIPVQSSLFKAIKCRFHEMIG